jgi:hypothetical protein
MIDYTPENRLPQPFRRPVQSVLLRCVDMAECQSDAKAMILTMYESGLLSVADTFAQIAARGLEEA